ncbi:MAG: phosphoribosyltransferase [Alphaproteobacteria bacterium]|nr:phosphoribosyltransferase [Alphaproteobacteria bacterium]
MSAFRDRREAGRRLAAALADLESARPVVLALPRGGVAVAAEIATTLRAPLDLVFVRKLGVPRQPEYAMGAIAEDDPPVIVRNKRVIGALRLTGRAFDEVRSREQIELERRRQAYLGDRPRVDIAGRVVILVDDGIATGMTMRAAALATAKRGAQRIVITTPVADLAVAAELRREFGEVVCLEEPEALSSVGYYYADFSEVGDDEVREILRRDAGSGLTARAPLPGD